MFLARLYGNYMSGLLETSTQSCCGLTFIRAASSGPERGGGGIRGFFAASSNIATSSSFSSLLPFAGVDGPEERFNTSLKTDIFFFVCNNASRNISFN